MKTRPVARLSPIWAIEPGYAQKALDEIEGSGLMTQAFAEALESARLEKRGANTSAAGPENGMDAARYSDSPTAENPGYEVTPSGLAILSVTGPTTKKPTCLSWFFGGTATVDLRQSVRLAGRDSRVKGLCLVIDSPGGEVAGTGELGADIAALAAEKPVYAYVDDMCCSAAYWLASQCQAIYANSTAIVGGIGVICMATDTSEATQRAGVKKIVIATSDHKGAGAPGTVITDAHRAEWQRNINSVGAQFTQAVQQGRHLTDEQMAAVSDARTHIGAEAQALHLIDGICSLDDCLQKLQNAAASGTSSAVTSGASADGTTSPARSQNPSAKGTEENPPMRASIATALAGLGLTGLAARVLGAKDDTTEAIAPELAGGVKAELDAQVKSAVAGHPLLGALQASGIETPEQLSALQQQAKWGEEYVEGLRGEANKQAVVAFGVDSPAGKAQVDSAAAMIAGATPDLLKAITGQYAGIAQQKGLQRPDGNPGARQSAATPLANGAADAETPHAETPRLDPGAIYNSRAKAMGR